MSKKRGLSALVTTVLLIGFSIAIGGIILVWFSNLTNTQTQTVGTSGEKLTDCAASAVTINSVKYNATSPSGTWALVNVTISLAAGTQNVANFTAYVSAKGLTNSTTDTSTIVPGQTITLRVNVTSDSIPPELVRVAGLCKSAVPIIAECKAGQSCMSAV